MGGKYAEEKANAREWCCCSRSGGLVLPLCRRCRFDETPASTPDRTYPHVGGILYRRSFRRRKQQRDRRLCVDRPKRRTRRLASRLQLHSTAHFAGPSCERTISCLAKRTQNS